MDILEEMQQPDSSLYRITSEYITGLSSEQHPTVSATYVVDRIGDQKSPACGALNVNGLATK